MLNCLEMTLCFLSKQKQGCCLTAGGNWARIMESFIYSEFPENDINCYQYQGTKGMQMITNKQSLVTFNLTQKNLAC